MYGTGFGYGSCYPPMMGAPMMGTTMIGGPVQTTIV